jgi:hypothetical protein
LWKDTGLVQAAQAHPATCETLIGLLLTVRVFTVVPVRVDTNADGACRAKADAPLTENRKAETTAEVNCILEGCS